MKEQKLTEIEVGAIDEAREFMERAFTEGLETSISTIYIEYRDSYRECIEELRSEER